ncbi:magnesium chelatase domain-containing protein [Streptomyces echinoruber]|uniref:Lon proteolytic domain-containing protein n=1 Tax=Streptomyces echinoruber TaxID=68898 RepID=A0A918V6B3_9ACTN|nr:magnesium chelatase domain-containing protein [Streptomyces echinoruber]GGZ73197.1 hypothetical protein GCM10010389_08390 [Streptomyces echinoruber]
MTGTYATDPATAAHSTAFEIAYDAANAARRALYSQAAAFAAHLVREHLPEAAALTIDADARELHEVLDAHGRTLWHAPSSAGHGLPDSTVDEVDGILRDAIPFGNLPNAAGWRIAPQGLPYRTVPLPELPASKTSRPAPAPDRAQAHVYGESAVVHAAITPGVGSFILGGVRNERETRDRVRAAIVNSGYDWPAGRITVTVDTGTDQPAGTANDLAIACAILGAAGHYGPDALTRTALIGELGLDGRVRPAVDVPDRIRTAQKAGYLNFIVPAADFDEASRNSNVTVLGAATLGTALNFLKEMAEAW